MTRSFKNAKVELELSTEVNMLLTVETGIRGGICHSITNMQKLIILISKIMVKRKE